ncbi:hypothetical protein F5888DRAFT_1888357 [Russula emetica]|nr:hypothetical protein F5888DRAFT_1888357 [Russula emetica]
MRTKSKCQWIPCVRELPADQERRPFDEVFKIGELWDEEESSHPRTPPLKTGVREQVVKCEGHGSGGRQREIGAGAANVAAVVAVTALAVVLCRARAWGQQTAGVCTGVTHAGLPSRNDCGLKPGKPACVTSV